VDHQNRQIAIDHELKIFRNAKNIDYDEVDFEIRAEGISRLLLSFTDLDLIVTPSERKMLVYVKYTGHDATSGLCTGNPEPDFAMAIFDVVSIGFQWPIHLHTKYSSNMFKRSFICRSSKIIFYQNLFEILENCFFVEIYSLLIFLQFLQINSKYRFRGWPMTPRASQSDHPTDMCYLPRDRLDTKKCDMDEAEAVCDKLIGRANFGQCFQAVPSARQFRRRCVMKICSCNTASCGCDFLTELTRFCVQNDIKVYHPILA